MQDDWVDNLSMAEFAASNHINMSTKMTPFFADYGFYLQTGMESPGTYKGKHKAKLLATNKIVKKTS